MPVKIRLTGAAALKRKLARLPKQMAKHLETGTKNAIRPVAAAARAHAPKDTGELAASLHIDTKATEHRSTARVVTNAEHAAYNEFGTSRQPARPFMRPALYGRKAPVVAAIAKEAKKIEGDARG